MDYSVVIRTTGQAGEKYGRLLTSIDGLRPAPKEVIVVLPEGYALPGEQLGYETFCFSPKGMVEQRLFGMEQCKTPFALFCDDDVAFSADFVQKLHRPIEEGKCKMSAGPLLDFLPERGVKGFVSAVCAAGVPTLFHRERYCSVLSSSGYSYNRNIDTSKCSYLETESLPWTCFYAEIAAMKSIRLDEESWLRRNGYAAMDDQTMFYKAKLRGIKTVVVTDALYDHLDAKTSTTGDERRKTATYALSFNRYVFWYRFLYEMDHGIKKIWDRLCYGYRLNVGRVFDTINLLRGRMTKDDLALKSAAIKDAKKYIASDEYKRLPKVTG